MIGMCLPQNQSDPPSPPDPHPHSLTVERQELYVKNISISNSSTRSRRLFESNISLLERVQYPVLECECETMLGCRGGPACDCTVTASLGLGSAVLSTNILQSVDAVTNLGWMLFCITITLKLLQGIYKLEHSI